MPDYDLLSGLNKEATQLNLLAQFSHDMSRILEKRFRDTEEVRYDIPVQLTTEDPLPAGSSIYLGVATDNSLTSDPVWTVVRVYFATNKLPTRTRIRKLVVWDSRTAGW